MRTILLLNGPPRCGKDSLADALLWYHGYMRFRMSTPLKMAVPAFFDRSHRELEATKDEPQEALLGKSYRELQISLSEEWAKKVFGDEVFGTLLARRLERCTRDRIVVSDVGFTSEVRPLLRAFGRAVWLVRIERPGTSWKGDSRGYVEWEGAEDRILGLTNGGSEEEWREKARELGVRAAAALERESA